MFSRATTLFMLLLATPSGAIAQLRGETIRGRVASDSGRAVPGAVVSATMAPDRLVRQGTTNADGHYTLRFERGTGDYLVHVAAPGYRTVRKRLQRTAADSTLVLDIRLAPEVVRLAAVAVREKVSRPVRGDREGNDAGAAERERDGVAAALAPDQEGSIAALASVIPGATAHAGGLSVLGLDPSQSNTTLNGMAFNGTSLPRNARTTSRVTASAYDPARGGFSAGQVAVELGRGSRTAQRRANLTLDAPTLQAPDRLASRLGQRFTATSGSVGGSGEAVQDVWYYNSAAQFSRRAAEAASLLDAGTEVLSHVGLHADSTARLLDLLSAARVPLGGSATSAVSTSGSFVTRLDYKPFVKGSTEPAPRALSVTAWADVRDDQALSLSPTATPSRTGAQVLQIGGLQGVLSRYHGNVLNDSRVGLSATRSRGRPSVHFPGGHVLVSSVLADGSPALTGLAFGGNPALDYDRRDWTLEAINETVWYRRSHRIKLTAETRLDGYRHASPADRLGTFTFPSLAALAANRPSSFTRTLAAPEQAGGAWSGWMAIGDYWRATPTLLLLYGARMEASRFTRSPDANPLVDALFQARTSHAPATFAASPRFGFTWFYGGGEKGTAIRITQTAVHPLPPKGVLRGGIGQFRNLLPATLLSDAIGATGLEGSTTRLLCVGDAVPQPRFDLYADPAAVPASCTGGGTGAFVDTARTVRLFDPAFGAPHSWRGNLAWSSTAGPFGISVEGVYSRNLAQPGSMDLNFADTERFALPHEAGRPVFVEPGAIVPATGAIGPRDARHNDVFGRVVSTRSDLRSTSRQLTATITPAAFGRIYYGAAYTLGDMRAESRGFDGSTFASPTRRTTAPGDLDVRHQLQLHVGTALPLGMTLGVFGRFSSGLPYTPRIAGDVNGDGLLNDRAFVFDPDSVADPDLAAGLRSVLARAPVGARGCLAHQIGRAAERNGCRGPWTATVNARLGLVSRTGFTRRAFSAAVNVSNPLGGIDQLLHGAGNLRGWGSTSAPDPTLLIVRGFDPVTRAYRYEANPRFGRTTPSRLSRAPFRVTIDFTFDLGVPAQKQQAVRLLSPGRRGAPGTRASSDSIASRLRRQVPDIYKAIIDEGDSLLVSREQLEALQGARVAYRVRVDSIWTVVSHSLAAMGDSFDPNDAMHLIDEATERAWIAGRDELPVLRRILSPLQLRLAPWIAALERSEGKPVVGIRLFGFE